jgi:hypothetical protein
MNRDSEFNSLKVNFDRRVLVMRYSFHLLLVCVCLTLVACDLSSSNQASISSEQDQLVNVIESERLEVSCGQCQFGMSALGCDLAVRIEDRCYFLDGTSIDDHGDAHGATGFCNCVREATISGTIQGDRFVVDKFELLPLRQE